jgi:hypothetical protein
MKEKTWKTWLRKGILAVKERQKRIMTLKECIFLGTFFWGLPFTICFYFFTREEINWTWPLTATLLFLSMADGFLSGCFMYEVFWIAQKAGEMIGRKEGRLL